jgi:hypothetical protein
MLLKRPYAASISAAIRPAAPAGSWSAVIGRPITR